jgi:hypothetical protein
MEMSLPALRPGAVEGRNSCRRDESAALDCIPKHLKEKHRSRQEHSPWESDGVRNVTT